MDLQKIREIYLECLCWEPNLMINFLEKKRESMNYSLELFYKPLLQFHHDNLRSIEKLAQENSNFIDENGVLQSSTSLCYYKGFYQNTEIRQDFRKIILDFLEAKMETGLNPATSSTTPKQKNKRPTAAKQYPTFESMFRDKNKAATVLGLLQDDETNYKPLSKILAITEVLEKKNIIYKAIPTGHRNKLFAKELDISLQGRTATTQSKYHDEYLTTFNGLFSTL